jgi:hypothetical protein
MQVSGLNKNSTRLSGKNTYFFSSSATLKVGSSVLRFQHYSSSLSSPYISSLQITGLCGRNQPALN